jgi:hypothetical protein
MCQPMATMSICEAAVPKRRATHIRMKGRSRVRSVKLGGGETEAGTGAGPDIRSRIAEAS